MKLMRDIEADNYEKEVKASMKPVVLLFWIRSCDKCRRFKPVYEEISSKLYQKATFLRMNMLKSLENLRLAEELGVEETPTTKIFCGGAEAGSIFGFRTLEEAFSEIDVILGSDACSDPQPSYSN